MWLIAGARNPVAPLRCNRRATLRNGGRAASLILAAAAMLAGAAVVRANNVVGAWQSPSSNNWPLIAIHAVLTPDGRVLSYGTDGVPRQTGFFIYDIWDPTKPLASEHVTLENLTLTDIFCGSQVILPQSGSIMIAGGDNWTGVSTTNTGNANSTIFQYTDNTLSRGSDMNLARWYSSATVLMNGEIYIQGGNGGEYHPEVRQLDGTFRLLSDAHTVNYAALFPRNFLAPDGRVFGYDTNGSMYYVNPSGTGQLSAAGQFSSSYAGWTSSAAMFRPGKILQFGGNSNGAVVIDITGLQPLVTPTGSMSSKRQWVSATILADGRVLATGGSAVANELNDVNNSAEIWNPATGQWTVGPSGLRARLYHSGALLLPDGSVLITGGGAPGPLQNKHSEIYYPSYLYNSAGGFATRPVIQTAPTALEVGQDFQIGVGTADIRRLTLVKTGSVTHSVNMDQRFLELPFTASSGTLFVQMTDSFADAPPGYYLLFAFDQNGVPSRARIVRVNVAANPIVLTNYTSTIGGTGGTPYQLSCNSDETMVGIYGNSAGTFVDRVGARCARFDQAGRWIGDPVNRGDTGSATGTAYTRTCPRDMAVNGFRGRAGPAVNQLTISCRAVTTGGKVTGTTQFLAAVGGTGGVAQGPFSCSTDNPVYALMGRSGSWLDSFGMLCRQAPLTQTETNVPPTLTNPGNQVGVVGTAVTLPIVASDGDGDTLDYSASGLPAGLSIAATTGVISGTPTATGTYPVTISVDDGAATTTASFTWTITDSGPLTLDPMPLQPPRLAGTSISYTASAHNGINTEYHWQFDDGSESGWSSSPSVTHTFANPTVYWVTVTARDDRGIEQTQTFSQMIHLPLTATQPAVSMNIAVNGSRLWVVNQDDASVSVFNVSNNQKLAEIAVGAAPRALAFSPGGDVWVTNKRGSSISVIDPSTLTVRTTIQLPRNSQPYGIVFAPNGSAAFVALEGAGRVVRLDPSTGAELASANVGGTPRHLSISSDSTRLYAPRFVTPPLPGESTANVVTQEGTTRYGGEVLVLNPGNLSTSSVIVLRHSDDMDFENQGSGVPNYLGPAVISPDGQSAWVPSKKDNIKRGTLRSGGNLNFQNTVRAISSRIDLATASETFGARVDYDNASFASTSAFDKYGVYLFVALETSREVAVVDAHNHAQFFRINVGRAPQGLALSADGRRLYVSNFMDRTVGVYDLSALIDRAQWSVPSLATLQAVSSENLSATVLKGKQLFYDARDTRLAREGYMSCASCHSDGGGDGRVWDLTGLNEGLRNTIELRGRGGMAHGFLHWSGNFDEVQDFEGQIRALAGGTGLVPDAVLAQGTRSQPLGDPKAGLSADLDALAAFVASLNAFDGSPYRNADGSLTADGVAGKAVFVAQDCAQCHGGTNFTASGAATLFDVGTIHQPGSGDRLGVPLTGLDPPTLRGVWRTAPYLHDGSAQTLADAVRAHSGVAISDGDLTLLVAYLRQIDGTEPAPSAANVAPVVTTPAAQSGTVGVAASLQIQASDADGGTLSYSASNLPAGLTINASSGRISGTPTTAQVRSVTVTVTDGQGGSATTNAFNWTIVSANTPPVVTTPPAQSGAVGVTTSLQIQASDADGGTLSYSATNLPGGLTINASSGRISGTPTTAQVRSVTVTVTDGQGGSATTNAFSWTIVANRLPTVVNPGNQSSRVGVAVSLQIVASDADGDALSYSATTLPPGLAINSATGLITGAPTKPGNWSTWVTVRDAKGAATAVNFKWSISKK